MMVIKTMTLIDKGAELCKFYSMWKHNKLDSMREKMMKLPRANLADCESKDVSCFLYVCLGSCQIFSSVQDCTKILLHKDTFARVIFLFFVSLLIFFYTITVIPNPYPRSVTYILVFFFSIFLVFFSVFFTLVQN